VEFQEGGHLFLRVTLSGKSIEVNKVDTMFLWSISNFEESRGNGLQDCIATIFIEFA
jgi:hypothetical protein